MTDDLLRGVRVLEIGDSLAGAYATKLLVDLGAEVTWVPGTGTEVDGAPGTRAAADCPGLTDHLDAGKRTVPGALEPAELAALIRDSEVVVESLGASGLERAGIDTDSLRAAQRGLSVIRISPFGQTGPYRDRPWTDLTLQAASGWVNQHGTAGYPPFRVGGNVHHYAVGGYAALYAMTALSAVDAGLAGTDVDLSMMAAIHSTLPYPRLSAMYVEGNHDRLSTVRQYPFGIHRCRDGWVGLNTLTGQHWQDACILTEVAEYIDRYEEIKREGELFAEFRGRVDAWMAARDVVEVVEIAQAFRIPAVPVGEGDSVLDVPQWRARPFFVESELAGRAAPRPGPAWRIGAGRQPRPGTPTARRRTADDGMALDGLRILELGTFWAAPYLTCYLGAAGADVIKVESTRRPDGFRYLSTGTPGRGDWYERSGMWQATNLNKRDLTLDLTDPRGRELFGELLRSADVVVENFAVRVFEQLGLDEERLLAENPDLVILRMPGYGVEGPARDHVGWGNAFEQLAGIAAITGFPGEPPQTPGGYLDPIVGVHAGVAMLAALHRRQRGGGGRSIEVPQIEVGAAVCPEPLLRHVLDGTPTPRLGNASGKAAPEAVLPVAGLNGWIALSVRTDEEWAALVRLLGAPSWASAELDTVAGRLARATEIEGRLAAWSESRDGAGLVAELLAHGIPAAEVLAPRGFYDDAQLAHRGYFGEVDHPVTGPRTYPGWPGRTTLLPERHHRASAPLLGQHNLAILRDELGVGAADIDELEAAGVIGTVPRGVDRE